MLEKHFLFKVIRFFSTLMPYRFFCIKCWIMLKGKGKYHKSNDFLMSTWKRNILFFQLTSLISAQMLYKRVFFTESFSFFLQLYSFLMFTSEGETSSNKVNKEWVANKKNVGLYKIEPLFFSKWLDVGRQ